MAWQSNKQGNVAAFSPIGTRAILLNKFLDEWGDAYAARDVMRAKSTVNVLETYLAPYLFAIDYWPAEDIKSPLIKKLEAQAQGFAEIEFKETIPTKYREMTLEQIFKENPAWQDNYKQFLELNYSRWRVAFCNKVIEDNDLLGGAQDAVDMEGFDEETQA